jgi:flagellar basal body-associated protein FliL
MITKILLTLAVIIFCLWYFSGRRAAKPQLREIINPALIKRKKQMLMIALAFMLVMVVSAGFIAFQEFNKPPVVVTVHVINTQSGAKMTYRAIREEIQGDSFTTLDGRRIYVAGIERLEVELQ